jgi:hypothetical protein
MAGWTFIFRLRIVAIPGERRVTIAHPGLELVDVRIGLAAVSADMMNWQSIISVPSFYCAKAMREVVGDCFPAVESPLNHGGGPF